MTIYFDFPCRAASRAYNRPFDRQLWYAAKFEDPSFLDVHNLGLNEEFVKETNSNTFKYLTLLSELNVYLETRMEYFYSI